MSLQIDLSIFDVLNIYRSRWFLSRANLLLHVTAAQKAADGKISWVEFDPPFHSHLVKCAHALVPRPTPAAKKSMFVFILEVLNGEVPKTFFDLPLAQAKRGKRRLSREQQQGEARAERRAAPSSGGKTRVVSESQEPRPTLVVLDRGPFPRSHGAPGGLQPPRTRTPPPPPVESTPSLSPLLSLILKAPRNSVLYPVFDNPSDDFWPIPDSQAARRQLWVSLRESIGELRIKDWEVYDNGWTGDLADPAEEMEVDFALGGLADSFPSPSPPPVS
jgi:hypothetical protein